MITNQLRYQLRHFSGKTGLALGEFSQIPLILAELAY
jgi:sugar diacid utilization regulator